MIYKKNNNQEIKYTEIIPSNFYEHFSLAGIVAEEAGKEAAEMAAKEAAKEAAELAAKEASKEAAEMAAKEAAKEAAEVAAKELSEEAAHEAAEEAAKEASKRSIGTILKDGSKNAGKWVIENPLKTAGAGLVGFTGIEALIDKKKFSDVFGKNLKKGLDIAKPVTKEILGAATKGTNEILTNIVGKKNLLYAKYALLTLGALILLYYIKQIL